MKLAWRNIWRNRRRTILTLSAIAFGMWLIALTRGMHHGTFAQMIDTSVRRQTGHVQLQGRGYWEDKTLSHAFQVASADTAYITSLEYVEAISVKLSVDALVGSGIENTTGGTVVGVIPSLERRMTVLGDRAIVEGSFLTDDDLDGAVIGRTMARNLHAGVGDELIIFTQGRDGSMAAALLHIRGLFRLGEPALDAYTVIAHLKKLQPVLSAQNRATAVALTVDDVRNVADVTASLRPHYHNTGEWDVVTYETLLPGLMQTVRFKDASGVLVLAVLLLVIVFGVLNTILMSVMERYHELGVMMAIGMKRSAVALMIVFETLFISIAGLLIGNALGYLMNWYWELHPMRLELGEEMVEVYESVGFDPVLVSVRDFEEQMIWTAVMLVLTFIVILWPVVTAIRFRPVEAIRQV